MVLGVLLATGASLTASILFLQVAVLPLVFKHSKYVQRKIVFSNCFNYPRNPDYENPSSVNVIGGRNFTIEFQSQVDNMPIKLGVWHMIPCCMFREVFIITDHSTVERRLHNDLTTTANTIVMYCHGNSNHRASPQRSQMYKVFQELNYHVISFDYRGYGDSTTVKPTEAGVVEDTLEVYRWLRSTISTEKRPKVIMWGHSLGTAVVANMLAHMEELSKQRGEPCLPKPDGLVLEGAFNNLMEEIESHPFSKFVSWLPYFKETFVKPFSCSSEYMFTTDKYITQVKDIPILMLHARHDRIVPYDLAVKLHREIVLSRVDAGAPVVLQAIENNNCQNSAQCGYIGHNNLCEATGLKEIIRNFVDTVVRRVESV
ncbi:serine aminopeptidase, s33 domain-containing protein [Phthorimaea operculella]|nr:serine aminopeptidase, s33 domain-containing protein [Phthorimaea operculella]